MEEPILKLGECLDLMKDVPDRSIDLVLCDLPYGTTQNKWDSVIPLNDLWSEYRRVCSGRVVLTGVQPFTSALIASNLSGFHCEWIWEKNNAKGHLNARRMPMRAHESVIVFGQGVYNPQMTDGHLLKTAKSCHHKNDSQLSSNYGSYRPSTYRSTTRFPRSVIRIASDRPSVHPTQKPVALMEYFILTYSNQGMTVLDNCMGSGTTGVACINTNRNFIGIEKDPHYFSIAEGRISQAQGANGRTSP